MSFEFRSTTDKWVKCMSNSATIRAVAINATETANQMVRRHKTNPLGTKALSESMIAGLLLSSYCRSGEKANLNIKASGWCHQAIIDANSEAEVRGYILEREPSEIQLAKKIGPWGIGLLSVLRTKFEEAKPYVGTVPLLTGHLAKDLTFYWLQSEQVQSAVGINVAMDGNQVTLAEGFLIQAMPGATDQDIALIEDHLKKIHQFDPNSAQRSTPLHVLSYLLENQSFSVIEEKNVSFVCNCSEERVRRALSLIGADELQSMKQENKDVEVDCDFCAETYVFGPEAIEQLLKGV